jgi:hypothetical protein
LVLEHPGRWIPCPYRQLEEWRILGEHDESFSDLAREFCSGEVKHGNPGYFCFLLNTSDRTAISMQSLMDDSQ